MNWSFELHVNHEHLKLNKPHIMFSLYNITPYGKVVSTNNGEANTERSSTNLS